MQQNQTPSVSTVLKGSAGYLAPELLRGLPPRPASDLFAVGGLFFELLTGKNPFIKATFADRDQIFYSTLNDPVPPLAEHGVAPLPGLDGFIQKLLAKDVDWRYATAAEALDDLLTVLAPVAREASALALKKFLAANQATFIAKPSTASTPAGPSIGTSGLSGQLASPTLSMPPEPSSRRAARRRARLLAVAGIAAVAIGVAGVLIVTGNRAQPTTVDDTPTPKPRWPLP
jgi:serine/threonine protein kinase